jgi:DNA-binding NtrC family response regulator
MYILQDLFGFMTVTGVRPSYLARTVENIRSLEGDDMRLVVEMPTIPFSAESLTTESERFVRGCMRAFDELKTSFPDADLSIIFQYCAQQELAKRQVLGFHPLMHTVGNLQAAIFTECTTQVQLFKRLCEAYDANVFAEHELIFSDRSNKSADQLKDEISQRRYLKHPDEADEAGDGPGETTDREKERRAIVKSTVADIQKALRDANAAASKTGRDLPMLQFYSRGWNAMQTTILDVAKAQALVRSKCSPNVNCLLVGESGTGKEGIAAFLHYCRESPRGELVTIDCTAIPENLLESELFGHQKGAFTGATTTREGLLLGAKNGTVFLDEIGLMPVSLQAKLLRFIETRTFRPVGSDEGFQVPNCRVIAATSRNLDEAVRQGTFLLDLYNRLRAVTITLPPLRERREDISLLLRKYAPRVHFKPRAEALLFDYHWDGNLRELRSVAERYNSPLDGAQSMGIDSTMEIGVSTLLEDWPRSVARDYLEGAMKWRWPMREFEAQSHRRIYFEMKRKLEASPQHARDVRAVADAKVGGFERPPGDGGSDAPMTVGEPTANAAMTGDEFKRLFKQCVKNREFSRDDDKALWVEMLKEALAEHGSIGAAAKAIGIPRGTAHDMLKSAGVELRADPAEDESFV